MQISKPSKAKLKRLGFKVVMARKRIKSNCFVQCIDKGWFERHNKSYLDHPDVYEIQENDNQVLIFMEV